MVRVGCTYHTEPTFPCTSRQLTLLASPGTQIFLCIVDDLACGLGLGSALPHGVSVTGHDRRIVHQAQQSSRVAGQQDLLLRSLNGSQ